MPRAFVTGGAGYIGSVTAALLLEHGWHVTVFDDLSRGHRAAVPEGAHLVTGDIRDRAALGAALAKSRPDSVLHFAALAYVGESFDAPQRYFDVNVGGTASLLAAMADAGCRNLVFSSSCTVYGIPTALPITEDEPVKPAQSPYGFTKQRCEEMLAWLTRTGPFSHVALRYFNAAGAWGERGEDHRPETHLIPLVLDSALGRRGELQVFGDDYPTPDGTCIRDYIHIRDLASAHLAAANLLLESTPGTAHNVNLGTGWGHSIRDIIAAVERLTGRTVPHRIVARRPGDPPALVAANRHAHDLLGWRPEHSSLEEIVRSAWEWREAYPGGYNEE